MRNLVSYLLMIACLLPFFPDDVVFGENGYVDVHIHLDPMGLARKGPSSARPPRTPRRPMGGGRIDYEGMADNIVSLMDQMGVEKAMLLPHPQVPFQQGTAATYATCLFASAYYPKRLLVGGGGDTLNPLIYRYGRDEVTPEVRAQFREEAEKLAKAGIVVFGEMAALHLSMQERHIFSQVDPDHPLFLLLADIAAENNIPIDLHMEAVPKDMSTPENLLKISSRNPTILKANIGGLERLLEHNRKARIVWQHIGWDNIGYMTIELLTSLLERHPNLYLALRVEYRNMKMDESGPMPNRIVDEERVVRPEWEKFIADFSDRIVIGSDDFMGLMRPESRPQDSFKKTWSILEQFPEEIASKIGRDNAVRIYNLR